MVFFCQYLRAIIQQNFFLSILQNGKFIYINISSPYFTLNHLMKLLLTILLSLLLLQSVTALHLHTEEDGSGNVTSTTETSNLITIVDSNLSVNKSADDEQASKAQKDYDAIQASGDEELIAAAEQAKEAFEKIAQETKEKVESYSKLGDNATGYQAFEAINNIQKAKLDFKFALDELTEKLAKLRQQLSEKQAKNGTSSS